MQTVLFFYEHISGLGNLTFFFLVIAISINVTYVSICSWEIMEQMSMHQQTAYDRLYRWVKDEFHQLKDDPDEINPLLVVAGNVISLIKTLTCALT